MSKWIRLGVVLFLVLSVSGCGGGDDDRRIAGPGLVGIADDQSDTAPLLTVVYEDPLVPGLLVTAQILSDRAADGDIAFDPFRSIFTITTDTSPLFFGVDSLDPNLSEFRAFLTFPLDGLTGQDVVPSGAFIDSATLELFVTDVDFAGVIPTFLDLVPYDTLGAEDFDAPFLDFLALDFFSSDAGNFVLIEVTLLMETAQVENLLDFQIRLGVDRGLPPAGAASARPQAAERSADRTASPFSISGNRPERDLGDGAAVPRTNRPGIGGGQ